MTKRTKPSEAFKQANAFLEKEGLEPLGIDPKPVLRVPTGLIMFDDMLGWGPRVDGKGWVAGVPVRRFIECYGKEEAGKTTLALRVAAAYQMQGFKVLYIDFEHKLDWAYVAALGIKAGKPTMPEDEWGVCFVQPLTMEKGFDASLAFMETGAFHLVIIDSLVAGVPEQELDGEMGNQQIGLQARVIGKFYRKAVSAMQKSHLTVWMVNQIRTAIGEYKSPEKPGGGKAPKFWSAVRLNMYGKNVVGGDEMEREVSIRLDKQQTTARQGGQVKYRLAPGIGFDEADEALTLGAQFGIFKQGGAWWSEVETDVRVGQGRPRARTFIRGEEGRLDGYRGRILAAVAQAQGKEYQP